MNLLEPELKQSLDQLNVQSLDNRPEIAQRCRELIRKSSLPLGVGEAMHSGYQNLALIKVVRKADTCHSSQFLGNIPCVTGVRLHNKPDDTNMQSSLRHSGIDYLKTLQYVVLGSVFLYFGRDLLIPLSFATLISCILYPIALWMERKGASRLTATGISVMGLCLLILCVVVLLANQFIGFLKEWPFLQQKFTAALKELSDFFITRYGITKVRQGEWLSQLTNQSVGTILSVIQQAIRSSAFSAVLAILVPVYAILILYHRSLWIQIVYQIFPNEKKEEIRSMMLLTIKAYYNFIKGMGLVYLVVGILNSLGLMLLGIPHAILFGFIASILTFIPYVGIIVGSLLPITMAWITYDSLWYPLGVVGVFVFVQYLEANVIFPLAVSSRLHINTLIVLMAIILGGILWGVAGMILFIPFVAIIKLIADHDPRFKTLSMILGTKPRQRRKISHEKK